MQAGVLTLEGQQSLSPEFISAASWVEWLSEQRDESQPWSGGFCARSKISASSCIASVGTDFPAWEKKKKEALASTAIIELDLSAWSLCSGCLYLFHFTFLDFCKLFPEILVPRFSYLTINDYKCCLKLQPCEIRPSSLCWSFVILSDSMPSDRKAILNWPRKIWALTWLFLLKNLCFSPL